MLIDMIMVWKKATVDQEVLHKISNYRLESDCTNISSKRHISISILQLLLFYDVTINTYRETVVNTVTHDQVLLAIGIK